jgi:signal transduction histidine kinase
LGLIVVRHFARARAKEDILEQTVEARAAQLTELSQHLLSVRETERARIARELHDELGSCLTLLAQDLSQLRRAAAAGDVVSPEIVASMQQVLGQSVQQQRQLVHSLRPPMLDSLGLRAALDALARQFSSNQDMPVEFNADGSLDEVDRSAGISLYRIVQESLTNVARHAHATRVDINVTHNQDVLVLTISDDGRGANLVPVTPGGSLGLTGMRERARFLGGTLTVGPGRSGRGTVVEALIPIRGAQATADT